MRLTIRTDDEGRVTHVETDSGQRVLNIAGVTVSFDPNSGPWPRPTVEVKLDVDHRKDRRIPAGTVEVSPAELAFTTSNVHRLGRHSSPVRR